MKRNPILLLALTLVAAPLLSNAQVASVTWGAQNSNGLGEADGTQLAIGDLIRIGTFSLSDAQIHQSRFDLNSLNSSFIQYGTAAIGDDVGVAAHWGKVTSGSTDALGLDGQRIYYWAFNAPSLGQATEHGIFSSSSASWVFPANADVPNTRITDLEQVNNIVVGGFGTGTSSATGAALFNLAAVPEPASTAFVFGSICVAAAACRRWRRS